MSKDEAFKEKEDFHNALIEEAREKLGEHAGLVSDTFLQLQNTMNESAEIHDSTVEEREKLTNRNKELLEVNNNLFINQSKAGKGGKQDDSRVDDVDDEDPLSDYLDEATKKK